MNIYGWGGGLHVADGNNGDEDERQGSQIDIGETGLS